MKKIKDELEILKYIYKLSQSDDDIPFDENKYCKKVSNKLTSMFFEKYTEYTEYPDIDLLEEIRLLSIKNNRDKKLKDILK